MRIWTKSATFHAVMFYNAANGDLTDVREVSVECVNEMQTSFQIFRLVQFWGQLESALSTRLLLVYNTGLV